jgi:hypothetical protein
MLEIAAIVGAVLVGLLLVFVVYRAARTYDAGAHATFITTKGGDFYGALRAPMTIWDPRIKVLREKHAPAINIMTTDAAGAYFEKSLVARRTGEISLRGLVLPVGGIKEKILAARRAGIRRVILPTENKKDLQTLPDNVKAEMELVFAERIEDVLYAAITALKENDGPIMENNKYSRQEGKP